MTRATLFLIPARGASRRIPRKNLVRLADIPLVGWAARIARAAAGPGDLVVCSTDDADIAVAAAAWGATVLRRPASLATDDATSFDVAVHALDEMAAGGHDVDLLVLLQATSPLTDPADVARAVERARSTGRSVASVARSHPPTWHQQLDASTGTLRAVSDVDGAHLLTGAFHVISPDSLRRAGAFVQPGTTLGEVIPAERSVDIDEPEDLLIAEAFLRARPIPPLRIGDAALQPGTPYVIAEAGVNHDGDVEVARRLIDAAADAGADAVKFQTFVPAALASPVAPTAAYQRARGSGETQAAMLERLALPDDAWIALRDHARERGIVFLSTPFDDASADLLDALGVPAFKVGSGELTDLPFLERLARRGRPMLVSTGMATMLEVAAAVDVIRATGLRDLALLHCVSAYPAAAADANLAAMRSMREAFGLQTGWSDHTPGIESPIAAVALGAAVVEKHLTLDQRRPGPDHAMSLEPPAFAAMVVAIRATAAAIGDGVKAPTTAEREIATVARKSLHWARDRSAGSVVEPRDLVARRPGTGIAPGRAPDLVGRRTARDVHGSGLVRDDDLVAEVEA